MSVDVMVIRSLVGRRVDGGSGIGVDGMMVVGVYILCVCDAGCESMIGSNVWCGRWCRLVIVVVMMMMFVVE